MSVNQARVLLPHERLEVLNDELHIIRRLLNKPECCPAPVMDVLRMAVDYTHDRYQQLAFEMRRDESAKVNP